MQHLSLKFVSHSHISKFCKNLLLIHVSSSFYLENRRCTSILSVIAAKIQHKSILFTYRHKVGTITLHKKLIWWIYSHTRLTSFYSKFHHFYSHNLTTSSCHSHKVLIFLHSHIIQLSSPKISSALDELQTRYSRFTSPISYSRSPYTRNKTT